MGVGVWGVTYLNVAGCRIVFEMKDKLEVDVGSDLLWDEFGNVGIEVDVKSVVFCKPIKGNMKSRTIWPQFILVKDRPG